MHGLGGSRPDVGHSDRTEKGPISFCKKTRSEDELHRTGGYRGASVMVVIERGANVAESVVPFTVATLVGAMASFSSLK